MTKDEQNQIIKDALVRNLQKGTEVPDDIGDIYKSWVLGKIQEAGAQLQQEAMKQSAQQEPETGGNENGQ